MFDKQNKVILFIAEKETFMVRVLENKIKEAGFDCDFFHVTSLRKTQS